MPITSLTGLISDTVLSLPAEDVQRSCGVALDIGVTVGKIIYRSNKEYKNGQPIKPQDDAPRGQVHCAMFPRADVTGIISYIKDNCDLVPDAAGALLVKSSGSGSVAFRTQIETALDCKMTVLSEFDCFCKAFVAVEKTTPPEELFMPLSPENQALVDADTTKFQEKMEPLKDLTQVEFGAAATHQGEREERGERPWLLMMAGSGTAVMKINSDGTFNMVDMVFTGGRDMYGLASILTGENDFDKLVEMAEDSDGKTVDTWFSDLRSTRPTDSPKDNIYDEILLEDKVIFSFGKGVSTAVGEMKKGDLAFSTFTAAAKMYDQLISTSVRLSRAKEVYVCGNVFNTEFMRLLLCRIKAQKSPFITTEPYEVKFLKNGGMYGALGAFLNTE